MHYFSIFFKHLNKLCVHFFARLDEKHELLGNFEKILNFFDENSIEKLNFLFFIRKFVTKNRAFGNNTIFLQQFFRFRGGGGISPLPPGYALALENKTIFLQQFRRLRGRGLIPPSKFTEYIYSGDKIISGIQ